MKIARALAALAVLPMFAGCGPGAAKDEPLDVRVKELTADPAFLDFYTGEQVIGPGEEKMFCTHVTYSGPEAAFDYLDMKQGKWGHHVVLLAAKNALPDGTVEDCSDPGDMAKFDVFGIIGDELPKGQGSHLHAGRALVLQSHYVNTGAKPILVRDAVRIHTVPVASVTKWGSAFVNNNLAFNVPAKDTLTVSSDCVVPEDIDVMQLGGHLHENGASFETLTGPDKDHLTSIYKVAAWTPEFRDAPPILLRYNEPLHWAKGTVVRTVCSWKNQKDKALVFPEEMCVTFGYAAGIAESWNCLATKSQ